MTDVNSIFNKQLHDGIRNTNKEDKKGFNSKSDLILPKDLDMYPISPSRLSIKIQKENGFVYFHGNCRRALVFKTVKAVKSNPPTTTQQLKMSMGKYIEQMYQDFIGKSVLSSDIQIYNNVSFFTRADMFDIPVYGEIDILFVVNGEPIPIEIKSFSGYRAERMYKGTRYFQSQPKAEHYLQTTMYLYILRNYKRFKFYTQDGAELNLTDSFEAPASRSMIKYIERAYGGEYQFQVNINKDENINKSSLPSDHALQTFDNFSFDVYNDKSDHPLTPYPFTMYDLFKRAKNTSIVGHVAREYVSGNSDKLILPKRDPIYQYSNDRLQYMCNNSNDLDNINKKETLAFNSWKSQPNGTKMFALEKGEWQCLYCDYKDLCLGKNRMQGELRSDEAIIYDLKNKGADNEEMDKTEDSPI